MSTFVIHYTHRSRWDTSVALHRAGCGKVPFEGLPGNKTQGHAIPDEEAMRHAEEAETNMSGHYKVCACAKKALRAHQHDAEQAARLAPQES